MIDIKKLEKNEIITDRNLHYQEAYKQDLVHRGGQAGDVDKVLELNNERKKFITLFETQKAEQNKIGQEIARLKKSGEEASHLVEEMAKVKAAIKEAEEKAQETEQQLTQHLLTLPNLLHVSVPTGTSEADNRQERTWGEKRNFDFKPLEHFELGEKLGILDFDRAAKVTGARFTFLRGAASQLERALIQFMLDVHTQKHGYEEIIPPYIVNSASMVGTGQFPKFQEAVFNLDNSDYYLIPTAEIPVTNYFRDEILKAEDMPKHFVAFSPCFRSEAGSYGKDTKGLIRQHQFHKVELLKFALPEESYAELENMVSHAEKILQLLELPYRVVSLCSADIGFSAAKCYDIEVWLPGQNQYREISSCSNCEDFQARRANIRYRPDSKAKPQFVHTLNGSGLAVGRTLIAILENYQMSDGRIKVPEALRNYIGGKDYLQSIE
ncbi:MAG: serine--tRNA ligase [Bdellovibrionales bacterium]|nr:serine--tRNA ligase [Bdellovibrionales bacterium]